MQPDLPWNVAGIPPEAREAARAAARREGLSVGEWMTRRILRSFSDSGTEAAHEPWRFGATTTPNGNGNGNGYRSQPEPLQSSTARDSEDMLARVSRTESETQNAYRRIEDQLGGVARRLEATERSQTENNRAMSKAAAEINIAAREQAQAFDQLGAHVVGLTERLTRMERETASDGLKDAVRALHQGLSRLADQMSQTANQSATQIAALAGNVEQVAEKLLEARSEAEANSSLLDQRIGLVDERSLRAERAAQAGTAALDKALEAVAASQAARKAADLELVRQASQLTQLSEMLERLNTRLAEGEAQHTGAMTRLEESVAKIAGGEAHHSDAMARLEDSVARIADGEAHHSDAMARLEKSVARLAGGEVQHSDAMARLEESVSRIAGGEAHHAGAMARLEESVAKLEARGTDPAIDRRLQGIEQSLTEIVGRLEKTERSGAAGDVEESLRNLALRVDAADKRHREAVAELRAAVKEASGSLAAVDPAPAPTPRPVSVTPIFDLPPFPDGNAKAPVPPAVTEIPAPTPMSDMPPPFVSEQPVGGHAFGADAFATSAAQQADAAVNESFLEAARRSARAASADVEQASTGPFSGFGWAAAAKTDAPPRDPPTRYGLIGLLALLIVGAVVAGILLSRSLAPASVPTTTAAAAPHTVYAPAAAQPQPVVPTPGTAAQTPTQASAENTQNIVQNQPVPVRRPRPQAAPAQARMSPPTTPPQTRPPTLAVQASTAPPDRLTALANSGNAKAEMLLGLKYLDGDGTSVNEAEAAKWLERAAGQNEAIAAYRLGTLYERGHGVPADPAKATQWYETAAKEGNRKAMHNLAVAYAEGNGVPKNLILAAQWFTRAANLGLADSQFNLAVLYERGMGVQQSLLDAYKWYAIAATQGDAESKARLDALATQLSADDKAAAQKSADSFRPQTPERSANIPPDATAVVGG